MYNDLVIEHFTNPRNVGFIEDADGVGKEGNPVCGDLMEIFIKVKDSRIDDIKFKTFGCGAAIATGSMERPWTRPWRLPTKWWPRLWEGCLPSKCIAAIWAPMPCATPSKITALTTGPRMVDDAAGGGRAGRSRHERRGG
jgi:hypothetical protein